MPPAREGRDYFNFSIHDGVGLRPGEGLLNEKRAQVNVENFKKFGATVITSRMNVDKKESPYEANISLYDAFKGTFKSSNNSIKLTGCLVHIQFYLH